LSRKGYPKQFLAFIDDETLLQKTLSRLGQSRVSNKPMVICNQDHRFIVAEQLQNDTGSVSAKVILEPFGRNTAPAVAIAALQAIEDDENSTLLVLPADHVINDVDALKKSLDVALDSASEGKLVTFGITPDSPQTGFGYIKAGASNGLARDIDAFVEKPSLDVAKSYLDDGSYYWNSGMFLFRADVYLQELKKYRPDIFSSCVSAFEKRSIDLDFIRLPEDEFQLCPDDSIDYAVMEKTDRAVVVPLDAGWSDVGSWSAVWDVADKDENGNSCRGDVITEDTNNSLLYSEERLIAAVGVSDVVVVETKDAILVADKGRVQDVKKIVNQMKAEGRPESDWHREVYRPWGCYDSIDSDERFQVKRITVKPGATLSLQKHHHRAEHWIVVSGTAEVTCGDKVFLLAENQSTYIPLGETHRLSNPGKLPLLLIEVQSGSYLGEDDIVRFEDKYGRSK
jgi:mannose-1-phosphate guanylyltransferase/mannose-6-phosphate isomerase